jgi:hypothetical protein
MLLGRQKTSELRRDRGKARVVGRKATGLLALRLEF